MQQRPAARPPTSHPFAEVLEGAKAGEQWAFTALFARLAPQIAAFVASRTGGDAEDLTNEVFLGAFRNIATFDGDEGDFRAWVYRIARNKVADDHRRRARRPPEAGTGVPVDRAGGDVEAEALGNLGHRQLRRLLATLTPDQHDVLVLRLVADLSIEQTATAMGKPPGAVKALQRRALESLRRTIASEAVSL